MRLRFWLAFLVTGGVLLVPGCNFPRPPIVCPATDLVAPMLKSPDGRATTTDTTPTLMWRYRTVTYPYPQPDPLPSPEYQCRPNKFRISLSTAPDFTDELGAEVGGGIAGEWTTPILEIGRTYRWSVTAISKGVDGPASETRYLSIGDDCDPTSVQAPILLAPANGSTVDTLTPRVMWDVAGTCLPIGYTVEYSQDAAFNTSMQVGTTGYYAYDWQLPELKDCATYYWRVLAWDGLGAGPYSEVWSFDVQRPGLCLEMAPAPALPGEVPPTLTSDERVWTVIMNANCRTGPGTVYNETSYVPEGYEAPV
ncbi:MAG: hypothetical protein ACK2T0_02575, partial [Anaerolineales bacterium]